MGSMVFSYSFSFAQLFRMTIILDYSDASFFQDQKTFDLIINNEKFNSFKFATSINLTGGFTNRRLRGFELDQILDFLGPQELQSKTEVLNKTFKSLQESNAAVLVLEEESKQLDKAIF